MVVVDDLDEGLDLVALLLALFRHPAGDLGGVALDAGDDGVAELVGLLAVVDGLKDDNLVEILVSLAVLVFPMLLPFPRCASSRCHALSNAPS